MSGDGQSQDLAIRIIQNHCEDNLVRSLMIIKRILRGLPDFMFAIHNGEISLERRWINYSEAELRKQYYHQLESIMIWGSLSRQC